MTRSPAQRNEDAERRALAEGHRCYLQPDGTYRVVSDSRPGKHYIVAWSGAPGRPASFACHPVGTGAYDDDHLHLSGVGVVPCKHAALVARRLRRARSLRPDEQGLWSVRSAPVAAGEASPEVGAAILARLRS